MYYSILVAYSDTNPGVVRSTTTRSFCNNTTIAWGSWKSVIVEVQFNFVKS